MIIIKELKKHSLSYLFLLFIHYLVFTNLCFAAFSDRVVAFVDDRAITLSEFSEQFGKAVKASPDLTKEEVVNTMINRILLLRDAKKYGVEANSADETIREYIDLKVRAFITIGEKDIETFYKKNINQFSGNELEQVKGEIERYLTEKEVNEKLKELLADLRKNAYIRIQLDSDK